jgi:fructoselysine 6-kinase
VVRLIGVGDNTVDQYPHLGLMFPGGNALNVAVFARRLAGHASYIGWLGDDKAGHLILDALNEEGVNTSRVRMVHGPTSTSEVLLVDGDRTFGPHDPGVKVQIALEEDDYQLVRQHDVTHTSIYSRVERYLPRLSQASDFVSFDYSQDWSREYLGATLQWTDLALLSHPQGSRESVIDLVTWVASQGPSLVMVTRGEQGALAYDGHRLYEQGVKKAAEVIDTLGAGDAFIACFLVKYLDGVPVAEAMSAAADYAAQVCGHYGAFGHGLPL